MTKASEPIDLAELDPGIREFVRFLRMHGFDTSDSGDGVSKHPEARGFDSTHVAITVEPARLCLEADRLMALLQQQGLEPMPLGPDEDDSLTIEATYNPAEFGYALILVMNIPINWTPT